MPKAIWAASSWALRVGCLVHLIQTNVIEISESSGESMLPTINYSGDNIYTLKYYRRGRDCHMGDMVIASKPTDPLQFVCKRITGMPGDYVLVDPTCSSPSDERFGLMLRVPEGHFWLTGDNLVQSLDSRSYGPVALGLIKGKVIAVSSSTDFQWVKNKFTMPSAE